MVPSNRTISFLFAPAPESERGSVVLETGICTAFLVVLLMALVDLGILLHDYIILTQVTSEGARYASRTPDLQEGTYPNQSLDLPTSHQMVLNRVLVALQVQNQLRNLQNINILSAYTSLPDDRVQVQVTGTYRGFFPLFRGLQLTCSHSSAYLIGADSPIEET